MDGLEYRYYLTPTVEELLEIYQGMGDEDTVGIGLRVLPAGTPEWNAQLDQGSVRWGDSGVTCTRQLALCFFEERHIQYGERICKQIVERLLAARDTRPIMERYLGLEDAA